MIISKMDLKNCLHEDSKNYLIYSRSLFSKLKYYISSNPINDQRYTWSYILYLRKLEYAINTGSYLLKLYYLWRLRKLSYKTGIQIPPNTIGSGLTIWHWGIIIINDKAIIGSDLTIHPDVVIGKTNSIGKAPNIGNNCYICSGARILGDITIGDNVTIAPNTVVFKNVPSNCVVAGNPAKIIKKDGVKVCIDL